MGTYKAAIVTERGQNVIAQALAENKPVMFTSAKTSSYAYPLGTNIVALTGLSDVVQSVIPSNSQVINKNVAQVSARFDNDGITQQYQIQTIGLYAQIEGGEEILFSVTQAITPDEMPVQSSVSPSAFIYNIQLAIQNAAQISVTVNPAGTATVADILAITNPEFDDSGIVDTIKSFPDFLKTFKSKMNIFQFLRNLKAGLQFVLHTGQIVNNCTSEAGNLPLSAKQGKVLMDLYTQLYSDITNITNRLLNPQSRINVDLNAITETGIYWIGNSDTTLSNRLNYPDDAVNGWLQVVHTSVGTKQIYYRYGTPNLSSDFIYMRTHFVKEGWTRWIRFSGVPADIL